MSVEVAWVGGELAWLVAGEFHVAAKGQEVEAIVRTAAHNAEKARAEADCEGFHTHAEGFRHSEVAELMNQHHKAEYDQELDNNPEKMHAVGRTS